MKIPKDLLTAATDQNTNAPPSMESDVWRHKLLQAQDYARRGHYDQAERLLLDLNEGADCKAAVLDLKGKMFAQ